MKKINFNFILYRCMRISGWVLLLMIIVYFISGYALVEKYGFEKLMAHKNAWYWHSIMTIPFLIALFLHIFPVFYFAIKKDPKNFYKRVF